jgi:hypothetical protein
LLHLAQGAQAERQEGVESTGDLADESSAKQKLVRRYLGFSGRLF